MTAKADLLRALKDRQRFEEVVRAECLGIARKRKMSTEAIARVGVELGVALRTSSPGKPTTVEEAVTSLVRIHFGGLERGSSEANEELEEAAANDENTVSTIYVRTTDTNALFYDEKSGAGEKLKEASSASAVRDSPDQDPQLELDKPDQSVERTTTTDSTRFFFSQIESLSYHKKAAEDLLSNRWGIGTCVRAYMLDTRARSVRDIHRKTPSQAQPATHSATGPQPTYADRASCPLSAPRPGKVSSTALAAASAAHASHGPIPQSSRAQAPVGAERPHSRDRSSTGQPVAVGHLRRGVQPLESDDEDDLWTLVSKSKPTGKKAAIYVGNLDDSACEEKLCNFIDRRSKKAGIKSPKIHSCSILRREGGWTRQLGSSHCDRPPLPRLHLQR